MPDSQPPWYWKRSAQSLADEQDDRGVVCMFLRAARCARPSFSEGGNLFLKTRTDHALVVSELDVTDRQHVWTAR